MLSWKKPELFYILPCRCFKIFYILVYSLFVSLFLYCLCPSLQLFLSFILLLDLRFVELYISSYHEGVTLFSYQIYYLYSPQYACILLQVQQANVAADLLPLYRDNYPILCVIV